MKCGVGGNLPNMNFIPSLKTLIFDLEDIIITNNFLKKSKSQRRQYERTAL
jgi:hypothetical protein